MGFPIPRWATRFEGGAVRLRGQVEATELLGGLALGSGEVILAFTFEGEGPNLLGLALEGAVVFGDKQGSQLDGENDEWTLDGEPIELDVRLDLFLENIVSELSEVAVWAEVFPMEDLLVKFQHGVQVGVSNTSVVRIEGATTGKADGLRLSQPLKVSVDGDGLRLSHQKFRRLAALADVRIEGATLHPDGEVQLRGGSNSPLDRVVRSGLRRAGSKLSELVRRSPRFARVRNFLRDP